MSQCVIQHLYFSDQLNNQIMLHHNQLNQQQIPSTQFNNQLQSPRDPSASAQQIQLQFHQQNIHDMNKFDVHQIYSNNDIIQLNKYRSQFIFFIPIVKRGHRCLIAIQKSHVIWAILKIIVLSLLCYYLYQWINSKDNIWQWLKTFCLCSLQILPFVLLLVNIIDPGYVLDHEIYQNQYEQTDDRRRPKEGKYCEYCKLFVRRKTGHCYKCNHCVGRYDHHCGIMGRCVGGTNAVLFYTFVVLANVMYMITIGLVFYEWVLV